MTTMKLRLRPGEKLYINGAVIKVDRRVSLEILNNVAFLLEGHVLQAVDATTPLRQLYFAVQSALMDPSDIDLISSLMEKMLGQTIESFSNRAVISSLMDVGDLLARRRYFEALRVIRGLYPIESEIMMSGSGPDFQAA